MSIFSKKYRITLLNKDWVEIKSNILVSYIPGKDNLIYVEAEGKYYTVLNVIHKFDKKFNESFFIILDQMIK